MIKNPSYSARVRISEESSPGARTTRNPHAVDNVNKSMGPRTGNAAARPGKRSTFVDNKQERAPLADIILRAYGDRNIKPYVDPREEGISPNTRVSSQFKKS